MNVKDAIPHIQTQINFRRTPKGRPINDEAISYLQSIIEDQENYSQSAVQCLNCGLILSSVTTSGGCPNCGGMDLTFDIMTTKIKKEK